MSAMVSGMPAAPELALHSVRISSRWEMATSTVMSLRYTASLLTWIPTMCSLCTIPVSSSVLNAAFSVSKLDADESTHMPSSILRPASMAAGTTALAWSHKASSEAICEAGLHFSLAGAQSGPARML
ncbi:uncharacterized protein PITG_21916 [Phytophthora infestans T30-4]|uniref:Uncharacterized protein n=1 Tax=Phytophthora infestans (strain T30-4) TaxID=403677 RepID=D0P4R6_PHYIT|nr:uncharacterized protein PITG_21916 [Phytophthora infestans T30-4]EEY68898.1 hypothetical protein PITG_21916 [Phytophthora infestans T30-4]|eukprot:XP_002996885.1 hypothetical protein PITG_21916 [Phytophthora infestans T30-4]